MPQHHFGVRRVGPGLTADCVLELRAYAPTDPEQQRLRAVVLEHLTTRTGGWSRDCPGAHVTASSMICVPSADRVLLMHHRKLDRWVQTGGHIESGDTGLAAAALREASEESGLAGLRLLPGIVHLDAHEAPCGTVRPCTHLDARFLVLADPDRQPVPTAEAKDVRWFAADALPTDESSVTVLVDVARQILG